VGDYPVTESFIKVTDTNTKEFIGFPKRIFLPNLQTLKRTSGNKDEG